MPEKVPDKEIEKPAEAAALPALPAKPKPKPVELLFDEGDALFGKRSDV